MSTINIDIFFDLLAVIIFAQCPESLDFEDFKSFPFISLLRENLCRGHAFAMGWIFPLTLPPSPSLTAMRCKLQQTQMREFLAPYGKRSNFAELAMRRFEARGFDRQIFTNTSDQRALVAAEVTKAEIVVPSGGGAIQKKHKEIFKPNENAEDDYDD